MLTILFYSSAKTNTNTSSNQSLKFWYQQVYQGLSFTGISIDVNFNIIEKIIRIKNQKNIFKLVEDFSFY